MVLSHCALRQAYEDDSFPERTQAQQQRRVRLQIREEQGSVTIVMNNI